MKSDFLPLSEVIPGKNYIIDHISDVKSLSGNLQGYGISPGTNIKQLFASPSGDPCAYEILGTVIALRHNDSQNIYIKKTAAYD